MSNHYCTSNLTPQSITLKRTFAALGKLQTTASARGRYHNSHGQCDMAKHWYDVAEVLGRTISVIRSLSDVWRERSCR